MNLRTHPHLTLTSLPVLIAGQLRMAFTLSLGFALNTPEGRLIPPAEAWDAAMQALEPEEIPDMGLPKPAAEWLMAGAACAPLGTETTGLPVDVTVGSLQRRFLVSGDAENDGISVPSPRPFRQMPLNWARTLGGTDHPQNPLGCGLAREKGLLRLPNVTDRNDQTIPACPGALGLWPSRMQSLGTFDTAWLLSRWPGVPDNFDWSFYHLAQPCQRFPRFLTGCENIHITNMHPEHAVISGRLPGLRVRLFADYGTEDKPGWREATVCADTVWLFPNALAGLLLWHASLPTVDERGTDIYRIVAGLEPADAPSLSEETFLTAAFMDVAEAETEQPEPQIEEPATLPAPEILAPAVSAALPDMPDMPPVPELPEPPQATFAQLVSDAKNDLPGMLPDLNAALSRYGLPPVNADAVCAVLDKQAAQVANFMAMPLPDTNKILQQAGLPENYLQTLAEASDLPIPDRSLFPTPEAYTEAAHQYVDSIGEAMNLSQSARKTLLLGLLPESLQQLADEQFAALGQESGPDMQAVTAQIAKLSMDEGDAGTLAFLKQVESILGGEQGSMENQFINMTRTVRASLYAPDSLPLSDMANAFPDQTGAFSRLSELIKQPPDGLFDLTSLGKAAGLSGIALATVSAIDPMPMALPSDTPDMPEMLSHPVEQSESRPATELEQSHSASTVPDTAALPETPPDLAPPHDAESFLSALTAGHPLEGIPLQGLDGSGLILRGVSFVGLSLRGLLLDGACCADADFSGCDLSGARFSGASFAGARLVGADLTGCALAGADFTLADLAASDCTDADFTGARLTRATLADAVCHNADFSGTELSFSRWQGVQGRGVTFGCGVDCGPCRGVDADFSHAVLPGTTFAGAVLEQPRFVEAFLDSGTFQDCGLTDADFSRAMLHNLRMYDTHLTRGRFVDADLANCGWLRVTAENLDARNLTATSAVFEECTLQRSDWACTSARQARWLCCDLRGARLDRIDMLDGALRGSRLGDASLAGANLYNADLYRMGVNEHTVLLGANLENTCLTLADRANR